MTASTATAPTRAAMTIGAQARAVRWATIAGLVVVWEVGARYLLAGNSYIAPPSRALTTGLRQFLGSGGGAALWETTSRFLLAFAVVVVVAPLMGLLIGRLGAALFGGMRDVFSVLLALPLVPFYPLLVLWFGIGAASETVFGVIHGLVPVVLMTMVAAREVPAGLVASARAMGASRRRLILNVVMPAVLPDVMSALKVGSALTLLGVMLGELMLTVDGVGSAISGSVANGRAEMLTAIVALICVGAIVVNAILGAVERRFSFWRQ